MGLEGLDDGLPVAFGERGPGVDGREDGIEALRHRLAVAQGCQHADAVLGVARDGELAGQVEERLVHVPRVAGREDSHPLAAVGAPENPGGPPPAESSVHQRTAVGALDGLDGRRFADTVGKHRLRLGPDAPVLLQSHTPGQTRRGLSGSETRLLQQFPCLPMTVPEHRFHPDDRQR